MDFRCRIVPNGTYTTLCSRGGDCWVPDSWFCDDWPQCGDSSDEDVTFSRAFFAAYLIIAALSYPLRKAFCIGQDNSWLPEERHAQSDIARDKPAIRQLTAACIQNVIDSLTDVHFATRQSRRHIESRDVSVAMTTDVDFTKLSLHCTAHALSHWLSIIDGWPRGRHQLCTAAGGHTLTSPVTVTNRRKEAE